MVLVVLDKKCLPWSNSCFEDVVADHLVYAVYTLNVVHAQTPEDPAHDVVDLDGDWVRLNVHPHVHLMYLEQISECM